MAVAHSISGHTLIHGEARESPASHGEPWNSAGTLKMGSSIMDDDDDSNHVFTMIKSNHQLNHQSIFAPGLHLQRPGKVTCNDPVRLIPFLH